MTQRQQRQEQMAVAKPHPLKGIINSNDDPIACGICLSPVIDPSDLSMVVCCGKAICDECTFQFKGEPGRDGKARGREFRLEILFVKRKNNTLIFFFVKRAR